MFKKQKESEVYIKKIILSLENYKINYSDDLSEIQTNVLNNTINKINSQYKLYKSQVDSYKKISDDKTNIRNSIISESNKIKTDVKKTYTQAMKILNKK